MCFTPRVSLATALIEFLAGIYIWLTANRSNALKLLVVMLYLLGMYQFSEFMICMTEYADIWSRVGFISYNFLPAVGLHIVLSYAKIKFPRFLLYLVPVGAAIWAITWGPFIAEVACHDLFVTIKTPFFKDFAMGQKYWFEIYSAYYFGFILISVLILMKKYFEATQNVPRKAVIGMLMATLLSLVPAYVFIVMFPAQGVKFPSIYCQFAIMFALFAIYAARRHPDFLDKS